MEKALKSCRICGSTGIDSLLSLGVQSFTGIFPKDDQMVVPEGPLDLVKCSKCDLVQLGHSFDLNLLYGQHYGYRSGLNGSMVRHLNDKVQKLLKYVDLTDGDLIVDIGSNDGTTLRAYPDRNLEFVGVDPTGLKFKHYYPSDVKLIPDFFSADLISKSCMNPRAKVVTSFSMFYDLEQPLSFMKDIEAILHDDGIWVFEQSYLKAMLETTSYDTICHEHLEYYGVKQILWMAEKSGLKLLDVDFNDVNGGSFSVVAAKANSKLPQNTAKIDQILNDEEKSGLYSKKTFEDFALRVSAHRKFVKNFFQWAAVERKRVIGYGASTKGNVLLQYCNITGKEMPCIAEVNEDKFGAFTPGSLIPIVSEAAAHRMMPDYLFVLPWHFKSGILSRETAFQKKGGKFVFPLPHFTIAPTDDGFEQARKLFS
jgi:hypothetical protein